jgi:hypothetical protein
MSTTNIHDAKTHFSKLVERVETGEEITVGKTHRAAGEVCRSPEAPAEAWLYEGQDQNRIRIQ